MRRRVFVIAAVVILAATPPRAQSKRLMTETDLLKFTWIADPEISPDGRTVAFVRVTVNEKENRYETSLYADPRHQRRQRATAHHVEYPRYDAALVAGWTRDRVPAFDREGQQAAGCAAVRAADGWRRRAPDH